jgi:acetylornithine/succinyldiaminopimelate/putrescine aminotransferase
MTLSNRQIFLRHVGQTSGTPLQLEIERAEGIYFHTPEGKRYTDLVSGVSVSALGHGHPAVVTAVKAQAEKHMHLMVYGEFVQSPQTGYAEWIASHLPDPLKVVYYVNSGSEAIEGAMKLAKRVTGRPGIVAFNKAYHGSTHGAMSIIGDASFQSGYLPLLPGISHLDFNDPLGLKLITEDTAAVVLEPIQAEAGIIEPEQGFLKKVRERCDATGALMILDEIQTGFGRTGKLFAFEHYDVQPDIVCFAKSFGGGMPLGAFVSSRDNMQTLTHHPPLGHITTFGGHPVSCAAGHAAQEYIEKHRLIEHAIAMGNLYRELMVHEGIDHVRGKGLFLAVQFNRKVSGEKLMQHIYENGIIVDQFLFCNNAFRIAPPLIITAEEVRESAALLLDALDRSRA